MASKIHTDNPKHHKYVCVNKKERKKFIKKIIDLVSLLFPYIIPRYGCRYRYFSPVDYKQDNQPNTKVIYDDCNHKSFRIARKTKSGYKHRGRFTKYIRCSRYDYDFEVKHFKRV